MSEAKPPAPLPESAATAAPAPTPAPTTASVATPVAATTQNPSSIPAGATIPATGTPAQSGGQTIPPTPKKDIPLPDIVLGGPEPFNAERSPLIRFIKLCTVLLKVFIALAILGFMLYYYLSISNPGVLPKYDPVTGKGPTPFKTINQVLAMPAQVMGKTKDVVASNDARVAELDHVIDVSEGGKGGQSRAPSNVYRPPTSLPEAAPSATPAGTPEAPKSGIGQLLAMPGQVVNQTKGVVGKNNARVGVLDGVIANPQGVVEKGPGRNSRAGQGGAGGATTPPPPPQKTGVSSQDTAALEESLINFSLAQAAVDAGGSATPELNKPADSAATKPTVAKPPVDLIKKVQLGGGITITSPGIAGTAAAGEPFLTWVMGVKVSGTFPGTPPRVMLNDRLIRGGDPAHARLKITFESLDLENRLIIFRDATGATVSRSY